MKHDDVRPDDLPSELGDACADQPAMDVGCRELRPADDQLLGEREVEELRRPQLVSDIRHAPHRGRVGAGRVSAIHKLAVVPATDMDKC